MQSDVYEFYKEEDNDKIWKVDHYVLKDNYEDEEDKYELVIGELLFSFDKKKIYTIERDKDNPQFKRYHTMWADLPSCNNNSIVDTNQYPTIESFLESQGESGVIYLYPNGETIGNNRYYKFMWIDSDNKFESISSLSSNERNGPKSNLSNIFSFIFPLPFLSFLYYTLIHLRLDKITLL